ncbi:MAG: helix-turn-helix domain-containing protein [Microbispora sp.]|nr:helix-turn-helix domain-containing protein [Microbispora sp.]
MSTWASRIADLRSTGMTLAEIGAVIGLAPSSVSDIEQGRTAVPSGDAALKLYELHKSKSSDLMSRKRA